MDFSTEEAIWLIEVFKNNTYLRGFKGDVKANYEKAEMILRGWNKTNPRSCSCDFPALTRITNSFFEQYEAQIMEIYNGESTQYTSSTTTTTKSGRKKQSV